MKFHLHHESAGIFGIVMEGTIDIYSYTNMLEYSLFAYLQALEKLSSS